MPQKYQTGFKIHDTDAPLIATMRPEHQAVLMAGGSYAEIAASLGIEKVGTVKSRLCRARLQLTGLREAVAR